MKLFLMTILISVMSISAASAHGGGCRKAHLPQCCHMDNSTGTVHCH
jgi:hypothetical protein